MEAVGEDEGLGVGGVEAVAEDLENLKEILRILIFAGAGILMKKFWVNRWLCCVSDIFAELAEGVSRLCCFSLVFALLVS